MWVEFLIIADEFINYSNLSKNKNFFVKIGLSFDWDNLVIHKLDTILGSDNNYKIRGIHSCAILFGVCVCVQSSKTVCHSSWSPHVQHDLLLNISNKIRGI